jgi:hypothetical protein
LKEKESEPLATNSRPHQEKKMSNRTTSNDFDSEIGNFFCDLKPTVNDDKKKLKSNFRIPTVASGTILRRWRVG